MIQMIENEEKLKSYLHRQIEDSGIGVNVDPMLDYAKLRSKLDAKDSLANDSTLTQKPYKFRGRYYFIKREVPLNPLIRTIH